MLRKLLAEGAVRQPFWRMLASRRSTTSISNAVDSMLLRSLKEHYLEVSKMNPPPKVSPPSAFTIVKGALDGNGPVLTRTYSSEEIKISVMRLANIIPGGGGEDDEDDINQLFLHVDVSKHGQEKSLHFLCGLYPDALGIHSVQLRPKIDDSGLHEDPYGYNGPQFGSNVESKALIEDLQFVIVQKGSNLELNLKGGECLAFAEKMENAYAKKPSNSGEHGMVIAFESIEVSEKKNLCVSLNNSGYAKFISKTQSFVAEMLGEVLEKEKNKRVVMNLVVSELKKRALEMFTNGQSESKSSKVSLSVVSLEAFKVVLDSMYSGEISLEDTKNFGLLMRSEEGKELCGEKMVDGLLAKSTVDLVFQEKFQSLNNLSFVRFHITC
ncbi:hypothetical protein GH714_001260 [Hevea brasiliensis]|uniref:BTB domain-containing protein n=1 Tax=Hevea brasiliensis TaxID=3981 RepID=A0A6A6MW78_HEVBR|nr:hypothetical protein GH714_001260 [Hevea brasiliensis]